MASNICYYCGKHLRIKQAALICANVLCPMFQETQYFLSEINDKINK